MKKSLGTVVLILVALLMVGCGSSSGGNTGNLNGNWNATLINGSDGSPAYTFSTTFTQSSNGALSVTNFKFNSAGPCFDSQSTSQTGSFTLSGNFSGNVTGSFGMMIETMFPGAATQNVLNLQGNVNGNTITGTWNLTGTSGCTGNGNFTINKS